MGSFEFGIYVYVWTWVILIGDICDLGFASAAQRFVPEYTKRKAHELLRGFLFRSRWIAATGACLIAGTGALVIKLIEPYLANYLVLPLTIACVTLPFYTLMQIQDGIARSYNWIHLALLPPYIIRYVLMLAMIGAAWLLKFPTDAVTVISMIVLSFAVTVFAQMLPATMPKNANAIVTVKK